VSIREIRVKSFCGNNFGVLAAGFGNWMAMSKRVSLLILFAAAFVAGAQTQPITATIDAGQTGAPISKYVYGQFIGHSGGVINNGIWAEMLNDRKFYYPVIAQAPASTPARGRSALRHWIPIRLDESVVMDTNHPSAGEHPPLEKAGRGRSAWNPAGRIGGAPGQILHRTNCTGG
jgi:hypothetical protein